MAIPPLPPLRIRETDGAPNVIPVFEIVLSNATLTDLGGGSVGIGAAQGQAAITFPLITGSGGTSINYVGSGGMVLGVPTGGGTTLEYKVLTAGANITITHAGSTMTFAATTGAAATGLATTAELYICVANTDSLSSERALTAGLGITIADSGAGAGIYVQAATPFLVSSNRTLTAVYPVQSGGNLGADRSFNVDTAFLVSTNRVLTAGSGLTGGGNLSADRTFSVNTNVRDKIVTFFAVGTLSTAMNGEEIRVYSPYNQEVRDVRLAVTGTPVGANILCQLYQFPTAVAAGSAFYSAGSRPIITTGNAAGIGSAGGDLLNNVLHAGSYLGWSLDQTGTTASGQFMTMTVLLRTS